VFNEYEGAWPIKDMIQQFLSNSSKRYAKDLADERKEKSGPDRKAVKAYLADLPKNTKADDNKSSLDSDSESESGDLEPTRMTKLKGKSKTALPADSESEDETDEESEEVC